MVLAAVAVAGVHHQPARQAGSGDQVQRLGHVTGLVVRAAAAAAQDHVRVRVPGRGHDRGRAVLGHAEERVPGGRSPARVHRHLHVAVGAVLEPDRHGQAGGELAVDLALGGPGADRAPGHGVRDVLRRDRVQPLAAHRHAEGHDVEQEPARDPQAAVHVMTAVHAGVVDQALPAGHRTRLLEVDPHHDQQVGAVPVAEGGQAAGVVQRGGRIVDRARPGDDQQAVIRAVKHGTDFGAGTLNRPRGLIVQRQLIEQRRRRQQRLVAGDASIPGARHRVLLLPGEPPPAPREAGDARSMLHPPPGPGGRPGPEQRDQEIQSRAARKFLAQTHNPPTVFTAATASLDERAAAASLRHARGGHTLRHPGPRPGHTC